ncbi:MAG TPA: hypothetical protein VGE36_08805, partial [Roseateles sp.]
MLQAQAEEASRSHRADRVRAARADADLEEVKTRNRHDYLDSVEEVGAAFGRPDPAANHASPMLRPCMVVLATRAQASSYSDSGTQLQNRLRSP